MRCPFKFKEFSDPERQQCEEDCALLTDNFASTDSPTGICAITLIGTMLCDFVIEYPPDRWYQHNDIDL